MFKVTIKGEVFSFDDGRFPMTEAIELEENLGTPFYLWKINLYRGSAKAAAGLVWLVFRREGRDTEMKDILSGAYELMADEVEFEPEGTAPEGTAPEGGGDPTEVPSPSPARSTSARSRKPSGSGPGSGTSSP
jgi:hypothetical protein